MLYRPTKSEQDHIAIFSLYHNLFCSANTSFISPSRKAKHFRHWRLLPLHVQLSSAKSTNSQLASNQVLLLRCMTLHTNELFDVVFFKNYFTNKIPIQTLYYFFIRILVFFLRNWKKTSWLSLESCSQTHWNCVAIQLDTVLVHAPFFGRSKFLLPIISWPQIICLEIPHCAPIHANQVH